MRANLQSAGHKKEGRSLVAIALRSDLDHQKSKRSDI
jgi:hypothetical protein